MQPYVLVLAQTSHEGAKYVRRAKLPRGRWRIVAKASSIRGIRKAEVHCLPGFHKRPDRHSILGELRYANCEWRDVEMPPAEEAPAVDQGDGMGEQLTIEQALQEAGSYVEKVGPSERDLEVAYRYDRLRDLAAEQPDPPVDDEEQAKYDAAVSNMLETPKPKRRRKCADCGTLHFKDEDCVRTDGVEEAPVPPVVPLFD